MACENCENADYTPEAQCCPDVADNGSAIDVRDRNCKIRRMVADAGIVGVHHGKFHQLDGSDSKPIAEMNIAGVASSDGLVIIQTTNGRILGIQPVEGTDSARIFGLIYQNGVLKFAPINELAPSFTDSSLSTIKSGILAAFGCSGDGSLTLGKLLPGCEGTRHLVIDADGNVTCDEVEVGACRNVAAVTEFDSIWGCKDGIFSPMEPVAGKTLVGAGDPVKWTLGDASSGINLITPRVQLASGSYSGVNNGIMHTSNISWAAQPGYLASYRYVIVRAIAQLGSRGMDTVGELRMDGQNMVSVKVREHPTLTCDHDTDTNQQILAIPGSKVSLLEFVLTDLGNSQANALNEAAFNFYLEGWVS